MSMSAEDPLFAPEQPPAPDPFAPPEPAQQEPEEPEQTVEIGGRQVPVSRLSQLIQVDDAIAAGGPEFFQRIADVVTGRARVTYEPEQPPSHYTPYFPGQVPTQPAPVALPVPGPAPGQQVQPPPQGYQFTGPQGEQLPPAVIEQLANEVMAIRAAQAEEAAESVRSDIAARYALTDDQVRDVEQFAINERLVENRARARGRMVNGRMVVPSPKAVLTDAFDMAARMRGYTPTGNAPTRQQVRAQNRQLVGTAGGQANRQLKAPTTPEEHEEAMTRELYRAFGMPYEGGAS